MQNRLRGIGTDVSENAGIRSFFYGRASNLRSLYYVRGQKKLFKAAIVYNCYRVSDVSRFFVCFKVKVRIAETRWDEERLIAEGFELFEILYHNLSFLLTHDAHLLEL
jgi:hypothetical protein